MGVGKDLVDVPESRVLYDALYGTSATLELISRPRSAVKKHVHTWLVGILAEARDGCL